MLLSGVLDSVLGPDNLEYEAFCRLCELETEYSTLLIEFCTSSRSNLYLQGSVHQVFVLPITQGVDGTSNVEGRFVSCLQTSFGTASSSSRSICPESTSGTLTSSRWRILAIWPVGNARCAQICARCGSCRASGLLMEVTDLQLREAEAPAFQCPF